MALLRSAMRAGLRSALRGPALARSLCTNLIPASSAVVGPVPGGGFFEYMRTQGKWAELGDQPALICHASSPPRTITYAELPKRVSAAAHALRAQGIQQGDVVNIHLHNCEQFIVGFLAIAALGGTSTTSNPAYTAAELASQHLDSGAKFVLSSRQYAETVAKAVAESGVASVQYVEDADCFANAPPTDAPMPEPERPINVATDLLAL